MSQKEYFNKCICTLGVFFLLFFRCGKIIIDAAASVGQRQEQQIFKYIYYSE